MFSSQRVAPSPWTQRATANMAHNQYFNFIPPVDNPNPYPVLVKFTPYGDDGDTYIGSLERCSWVKMISGRQFIMLKFNGGIRFDVCYTSRTCKFVARDQAKVTDPPPSYLPQIWD
ncbi:uncharacterized protein STEHIDRAFT_111668 [Stereum hirsutum FP-91666 SS1]|uniref:uncharacterized protein n=1 Tax=Stereum hirsutum (strain FP-91666) TaxID=721885 RepID=UPI000444A3FA|nr:uncharacterized protein STEHIDRAFT_111668 [Stereum hirsutum FP-91666 SS1]EIM86137.1 hypothetical protein STEHIDRAFT_111668 [Stereum hirsutum FP-91666 SS1]